MLEYLGKKEKGFTLMELLIAVAIVVILAGVGIPVYLKFMTGTKLAEASTNLAGIKLSEEGYKLANGVYATCGVAPRATPDETTVDWTTGDDTAAAGIADFAAIDFRVSGDVRFVYAVDIGADPTTFDAAARGNTDGDAVYILFTCTDLTSPAVVPADITIAGLQGGPED